MEEVGYFIVALDIDPRIPNLDQGQRIRTAVRENN